MVDRFQEALLQQILTSDARVAARARRRRVRGALTGAAAAIAALVGGLALSGSPAAADVVVTFDGDTVRVALTDLHASPEEVSTALRKADIDAVVDAQPVGPSNVGSFVAVGFVGGGVQVERSDVHGTVFRSFSFPRDGIGTISVSVGRAAQPGEVYAIPSDAFAAGEPLHCRGVRGADVSAALDDVADLEVLVVTAGSPSPMPLELTTAGGDHRVIESAHAIAPDTVVLTLVDPGSVVAPEPSC